MDMDLEQKAIMRLREAADTSERFYKAPLIVTTSGGKDSSVCVALAEKAGIDFEVTVRGIILALRRPWKTQTTRTPPKYGDYTDEKAPQKTSNNPSAKEWE